MFSVDFEMLNMFLTLQYLINKINIEYQGLWNKCFPNSLVSINNCSQFWTRAWPFMYLWTTRASHNTERPDTFLIIFCFWAIYMQFKRDITRFFYKWK